MKANVHPSASGLTKREYFACEAMKSLIIGWDKVNNHFIASTEMKTLKEHAYEIASNMLYENKSFTEDEVRDILNDLIKEINRTDFPIDRWLDKKIKD